MTRKGTDIIVSTRSGRCPGHRFADGRQSSAFLYSDHTTAVVGLITGDRELMRGTKFGVKYVRLSYDEIQSRTFSAVDGPILGERSSIQTRWKSFNSTRTIEVDSERTGLSRDWCRTAQEQLG